MKFQEVKSQKWSYDISFFYRWLLKNRFLRENLRSSGNLLPNDICLSHVNLLAQPHAVIISHTRYSQYPCTGMHQHKNCTNTLGHGNTQTFPHTKHRGFFKSKTAKTLLFLSKNVPGFRHFPQVFVFS